jgi:hypothetical protein
LELSNTEYNGVLNYIDEHGVKGWYNPSRNESLSSNSYWQFVWNAGIGIALDGVGKAMSYAAQEAIVQGLQYVAFRGVARTLPKPVFTMASRNLGAVGGEIITPKNSPYLTVVKGHKTFHISSTRVKEFVKNPRNPRARWGDQVDFKRYGVPDGSEIIKGAGKGHKRTPTSGELKMFNKYFGL